ncbi:MAG: NINE protein [Candidatus Methylacidiphilales bacterium]|nr:NINE protein [Candidatus Methylacidiphilales bacterium]
MYYLRWGNTQSGPFESHQILQMVDQGLVTGLHEVVDSVTRHCTTVADFRVQMQHGPHDRLRLSPDKILELNQDHIHRLQSQQDEIARLKLENEKFAELIRAISTAQVQTHQAEIQRLKQQQEWFAQRMDLIAQTQQLQLEVSRLREENRLLSRPAVTVISTSRQPEPPQLASQTQLQLNCSGQTQEPESPRLSAPPPTPVAISPLSDSAPVAESIPEQQVTYAGRSTAWLIKPGEDGPIFRDTALRDHAVSFDNTPIYTLQKTSDFQVLMPAKSRVVYVILGLLLGLLGAHNFYAERRTVAFAQLFITLFLGWAIIPLIVVFTCNMIELVIIDRDAEGVLME